MLQCDRILADSITIWDNASSSDQSALIIGTSPSQLRSAGVGAYTHSNGSVTEYNYT